MNGINRKEIVEECNAIIYNLAFALIGIIFLGWNA